MSRIYFHSQTDTAELLGSERAYMGLLVDDIGTSPVLRWTRFKDGQYTHPIQGLLEPGERLPDYKGLEEGVKSYLTWHDKTLTFGGEKHNTWNLVLNTVVATQSPVLCLLARIHAQCEIHGWFETDETKNYIADVIDQGRDAGVLRSNMGWEGVAQFLRKAEGPVVMSYSVCDGFPDVYEEWVSEGWPERQRGVWRYNDLTDEEKETLDARQEEWYELDETTQWNLAMDNLKKQSGGLSITKENLMTQRYGKGESLWTAMASEEWRQ